MSTKTSNNEPKPKTGNFFERNGLWETTPKKEGDKKDTNSSATVSNEETSETPFVFDFSNTASEEASSKTETTVTAKATVKKTAPPTSAPIASIIDPKIASQLKKVLTDANIPGPDYFELNEQLSALEDIIPDEITRYKAAYKSLTVQGITKDKISQSAQKYVTILESQRTEFSAAISKSRGKDIELKTQEASILNTENVNIKQQIADLTEKLQANSDKIKSLATEVQKSQTEIADYKKRFENTLNSFISEIQTKAEKVESYIA